MPLGLSPLHSHNPAPLVTVRDVDQHPVRLGSDKMFEPNFKDDLVGVHHVSQFEDGFLFDSCKKYIK